MTSVTEYGIVLGANQSDLSQIPMFDGEDPTRVSAFKLALTQHLNSKGINLPASIDDPDWMTCDQVLYAAKPENKVLVDQAMLTANPWMVRAKMVVGDLALSTKERKEYNHDMHKFECLRGYAVGALKQRIKPGCQQRTV